jgi:uncharacterized Zn finger protein
MGFWGRYVPVAERRAKALKKVSKLRKGGKKIYPVEIDGRSIAHSFWGKGWCDHLESFSDYSNRLPRGRTYVRNGSVCHLEIKPGRIEAMVSGSALYSVVITIKKLNPARWRVLKKRCAGQIGSMLELLQGKLSHQVMTQVTDRKEGLFPQPGEIEFDCDCPDWAHMCKHVAAVLYGVGSRLDHYPELLFLLRDVDAQELISADIDLPSTQQDAGGEVLADEQLSGIFGIDLDDAGSADPVPAPGRRIRSKESHPAKSLPKTGRIKIPPPVSSKISPTGKSVTRLRKSCGMSVETFARELGVSAVSVYRWEAASGRLKLQARSLNAMARLQADRNAAAKLS